MSVCVFDNPTTCARECWQDQKMICHYSMEILPPFALTPIPPAMFFFGANIGPWKMGQFYGDIGALPVQYVDFVTYFQMTPSASTHA